MDRLKLREGWDDLLLAIQQRFIDMVTMTILNDDVENRDELAAMGRAYREVYRWLAIQPAERVKEDDE